MLPILVGACFHSRVGNPAERVAHHGGGTAQEYLFPRASALFDFLLLYTISGVLSRKMGKYARDNSTLAYRQMIAGIVKWRDCGKRRGRWNPHDGLPPWFCTRSLAWPVRWRRWSSDNKKCGPASRITFSETCTSKERVPLFSDFCLGPHAFSGRNS